MNETALRQSIIDGCLEMNAKGLNQGTSGNISARFGDRILITPSAIPYEKMSPEMLASLPLDGDPKDWEGPQKPSSEWRFHYDIMKSRPEAGAIVHLHPPFATALAIARKDIPACHYMVAAFGGHDVKCSGYARYGTKKLSKLALKALEGRNACLLANHGTIVFGDTLDKALWLAVELETLAQQYFHALQLGEPVILSEKQIEETLAGFASYGLKESN